MSGRPIEPLQLQGNEAAADLIDNVFGASGFNARRLAEGAWLYRRMLEDDAVVILTIAGAMTPIGMSGVFNSLIAHGFVDMIISTGANLYHDMHRTYDCPMVQGSHEVDDNELEAGGVARIYDVYIAEDNTLQATDRVVAGAIKRIGTEEPISTASLHHSMGQTILETAPHPEKSTLATAAAHDVPIYTSSPGDSSVGLSLLIPHMFGHSLTLNPLKDIIETAALARQADPCGGIVLGGGSPKNFLLQTHPALSQFLMDEAKDGVDYFLQLTTDSPHWGGLSGATPAEAKSWGKVHDAYKNNVVVYSCSSITFPLIAQYVLTRVPPRPHKRLFRNIDQAVAALHEATRNNARFQREYADFFADLHIGRSS